MDCDFLIIGGGIAGVSAAASLSGLGRVLLLEAEDQLAHHASGRSAALYEPNYGLAPVVMLSHAGAGALRAADGGVLSPRGMMIVADHDNAAAFAADVAAMAMVPIGPDEARAMVPILDPATLAHAAYGDHAWDIDTDRLIQHYARTAKAAGGRIVTAARVSSIRRLSGGWAVVTPAGEVSGRLLVDAAGPWADAVAVMAGVAPLGLTPLRRSMARIAAPGGHDVSRWPMIFGAGETWYAKPDAGALIVSPAEEDASHPHDAWPDDMVLAEGLARYQAHVTPEVTRPLATWAGLRTFAPDRVPVIGSDRQVPGFFWLAGQGGYGFQTAPAASRLVADLIGGRAPEIDPATVAALSPARFG